MDLTRFTDGSIAGRQARLPAPLRDLHRAVLRRFLETGAPPTARWLRQAAAGLGLDAAAVDELEGADAVHVSNGVVTVAYPFSGVPTLHRVQLDGLPAVYAMCAIDALGLPAMTGRDGQITTADPRDGTPVVVSVCRGTWTWSPPGAVVVAGRATNCGSDCGSFEVMCPNTVFCASRESAQASLAGRAGLDGEILGQDTAIECGRLNFGALLGGAASPQLASRQPSLLSEEHLDDPEHWPAAGRLPRLQPDRVRAGRCTGRCWPRSPGPGSHHRRHALDPQVAAGSAASIAARTASRVVPRASITALTGSGPGSGGNPR
jgi:alkylmercury lyase